MSKLNKLTGILRDNQTVIDVSITGTGQQGESAYEVAVRNGFVGSEESWLDSLRYKQGLIYPSSSKQE